MKISGLQKLSLVDYPEHTACTIFTSGCNFACPFCHNSSLVNNLADEITENKVLEFLAKRKNILDAVCISGGEPTLQKDLIQFINNIKNMGYKIKLDTNGTNFEILKYLVDNKLIDYVAMDIKNSLEKYPLTTNCKVILDNIKKSIDYLLNSNIEYEFRTTLVQEFHTTEDIENISLLISGAKKYYLQKFVDSENCISRGLHEIPRDKVLEFKNILQDKIPQTFLRGY